MDGRVSKVGAHMGCKITEASGREGLLTHVIREVKLGDIMQNGRGPSLKDKYCVMLLSQGRRVVKFIEPGVECWLLGPHKERSVELLSNGYRVSALNRGVMMGTQQCEHLLCHSTVPLKMVQVVNFMLCTLL